MEVAITRREDCSASQAIQYEDEECLEDSLLQVLVAPPDEDIGTIKRKFLFRLVSSLHLAGNLSYRTEAYVHQVALTFGLHASCVVFPSSVMISFQESSVLSPRFCESYVFPVTHGLNCNNLSQLDKLCFDLIKNKVDLKSAELKLASIEESKSL
jgi:uncharacterized membrane protein YjjP (DUF1212 family)